MTNKSPNELSTPLSRQEIELIEATVLPALEKHHLRLLAHCLACFQSISNAESGELPDEDLRIGWCMKQPTLTREQTFIPILLKQLHSAGCQLETLANSFGITPLELTLQHLIKSKLLQHEQIEP